MCSKLMSDEWIHKFIYIKLGMIIDKLHHHKIIFHTLVPFIWIFWRVKNNFIWWNNNTYWKGLILLSLIRSLPLRWDMHVLQRRNVGKDDMCGQGTPLAWYVKHGIIKDNIVHHVNYMYSNLIWLPCIQFCRYFDVWLFLEHAPKHQKTNVGFNG